MELLTVVEFTVMPDPEKLTELTPEMKFVPVSTIFRVSLRFAADGLKPVSVGAGLLTPNELLVPASVPPVRVAVIVKFPVFDIVTLRLLKKPLENEAVVPPPLESAPVEVISTVPVKLVTVLLFASRAVTWILKGVATICVGMLPPPAASTRKFESAPGVMLKALEVAPVNAGLLEAVNVYPVPVRFIDRLLNVAIPPIAEMEPPPLSVPPPGFVPMASDTDLLSVVTRFPLVSSIRTVTGGVIFAPATALLGCWPKVSLDGAPGVILKVFDVAPVSVGLLDAVSVYPLPVLFIERLLNVAMPPTAATEPPPVSVPPPGFVPMASDTFLTSVVIRFPLASSIRTVTAGVIVAPATVFVGSWPKANLAAAPTLMVTEPEFPDLPVPDVAVNVPAPVVPV
jgi:hypothetical protein